MTKVILAANITVKGGVWRHLVDLGRGLRDRGCQVALALPTGASGLVSEAAGLRLQTQDLRSTAKADIWHGHLADTYDRQMLARLTIARRSAGAVILTEHLPRSNASDPTALHGEQMRTFGAWPTKTIFKRSEYALCHRVVCVSEASRRFVMIRYGLDGRKVVSIPNGVECTAAPAAWPQGLPLFVAVGSVIMQKGFDVLIKAATCAAVPWQAQVIGDGPHLAPLRKRAELTSGRVTFVGPSKDIGADLEAATALVVPSRWEAWPYVCLEAMERARPIVATNVDGLPEMVSGGTTGLLVNPEEPAALAGALDRLASDRTLAERMGRCGRERVASFGVAQMVDGLLGVYEEALDRVRILDAVTHRA